MLSVHQNVHVLPQDNQSETQTFDVFDKLTLVEQD